MAICDRSGLRVRYKDLKTTWDGLRVAPDQWEPKHPQLTPRKNVFDATALFDARPNRDPENVEIFIGFNYDPFVDIRDRPSVGVNGFGATGLALVETTITETGVGGTGAVGDNNEIKTLEISSDEDGVAGTGGVGVEIPVVEVTDGVSGAGGTGTVGVESTEISLDETGVSGTGNVGDNINNNIKTLELSITESGVGGTGNTGDETAVVDETFWGSGDWGEGTWGN